MVESLRLLAIPHALTMGSIPECSSVDKRREMDATVKPWRGALCEKGVGGVKFIPRE